MEAGQTLVQLVGIGKAKIVLVSFHIVELVTIRIEGLVGYRIEGLVGYRIEELVGSIGLRCSYFELVIDTHRQALVNNLS